MKTAEVKTTGINNKVENKADNAGNINIPAKANNLPISNIFNGESK